jgi:nicotinate-nucleotide adenylyltransferase
MVRLAIEGEPRFTLDLRELRRGGPGFTLETVREMQAEQPGAQWFLIIGQDQYQGLHTWHDWPELLSRVTLAVAARPGAAASANPVVQRSAQQGVALPMMDISSTELRSRAAAGAPIDRLVPPAVARYIEQHRLYHDGRGPTGS